MHRGLVMFCVVCTLTTISAIICYDNFLDEIDCSKWSFMFDSSDVFEDGSDVFEDGNESQNDPSDAELKSCFKETESLPFGTLVHIHGRLQVGARGWGRSSPGF